MLGLKYRLLKRIDRTIGGFLCGRLTPHAVGRPAGDEATTRPWNPEPVRAEEVQRILVVRPGGLGDAVLTFPMLTSLRRFYANASLDVLAEKRNAGLYRINRLVDEVYRYDVRPLRTLSGLREKAYDVVVDTEQYHYFSTFVSNYLRPRYLCGFDTIGRGQFQTHRVRYTERRYEAYLFLELFEALTGEVARFDPDQAFLDVDPQWVEWAREALAPSAGRRVAVIVPSATSEHRLWAPANYTEVAQGLVGQGFFAVILGGSDAVEAARKISSGLGAEDVLNLAGKTSLEQSAGAISLASIYISTDTGALHIAYGVGTPTVHLFGSGIQEKWAPPGERYRVVSMNLPCSPCTRYGYTPPCPYNVECMSAIRSEDVLSAVGEVLKA